MLRLIPAFVAAALVVAAGAPTPAHAGKFNKVLDVGSTAPAWEKLAGTDGKTHSLADLKDKAAVVVVFTCNSCPVAVAYEGRIAALAKKHADTLAVVAINVNTGKDDALPAMTERAAKKGFPFAYLYDPTQEVARKYGAKYTPEFFLLDKNRKVVYMGALDDKATGEVKVRYLEDAITALKAGEALVTAETSAAAGCAIRFNPKRDD
ncbi:MAG TPA: thioredoxin family protein [Urbifossiella sp.]|nr:thioredoxin family protein [Urbifossiella sp.]